MQPALVVCTNLLPFFKNLNIKNTISKLVLVSLPLIISELSYADLVQLEDRELQNIQGRGGLTQSGEAKQFDLALPQLASVVKSLADPFKSTNDPLNSIKNLTISTTNDAVSALLQSSTVTLNKDGSITFTPPKEVNIEKLELNLASVVNDQSNQQGLGLGLPSVVISNLQSVSR